LTPRKRTKSISINLSLIIPYFKSESIEELLSRIETTLDAQFNYEVIVVDDSESDKHWETLVSLSDKFTKVKFLQLSKNFGQHNALLAGISHAKNELVITIDDDLQNPPEEIPRLVEELLRNDYDLIYGVPDKIEQKFYRKFSSNLIRFILAKAFSVKKAKCISSYRVFRNRLSFDFPKNPRGNISVDALLFWCTNNIGCLKVRHDARQNGKSNYSIKKLFKFALDTITGYSTLPLKLATYLGLIVSFMGLIILAYVFTRYFIYGGQVAGFTFLASLVTIFAGAQLFSLGIMGEYLGSMHSKLMERPAFAIKTVVTSESKEK
jgi:undecaprenyl-phosphate 4-deoxy-4-formamido-L-arabinose transferase